MTAEEWTTLEWNPATGEYDDYQVLVNSVPREPSEDELRAQRRDEKWQHRGYVRGYVR